jgi:hypothetical protein
VTLPAEQFEPIRAPKKTTVALLALLIALLPFACAEGLYRYQLAQVPLAPPGPPVPAALANAAWVALKQAGPRQQRFSWMRKLPPPLSTLAALAASASYRVDPADVAALTLLRRARAGPRRGQLEWKLTYAAASTWCHRNLAVDDTLALWLNRAWFADRVRGIEAAAAQFVGKPSAQLDAEEAARLVALAQRPSLRTRPADWKDARDLILRGMRERGALDEAGLAAALARPLP